MNIIVLVILAIIAIACAAFFFVIRKVRNKLDLRKCCIEKYGPEFGEIYDKLCDGIPVGGFIETAAIVSMIEEVKKEMNMK